MFSSIQEMFMLFFSILFGIMLNSLIGLGAFPWGHALAGKDLKTRINGKPKYIKGCRSVNRLLLAIFILNILPLLYFALVFQLIDLFLGKCLSDNFWWGMLQIIFIGGLSLGAFAFYRFFLCFLVWRPRGYSFFIPLMNWRKRWISGLFFQEHDITYLLVCFTWFLFF